MGIDELILTALATGAAAGMKDAATSSVKDAVEKLRSLVAARLRSHRDPQGSQLALARYEQEPEVWNKPLRTALEESGATQDEEIIHAAQQVLSLVNPQQAAMGKYNVQITGPVHGFVQGDHAQVTMSFGAPPETSSDAHKEG